MLILIPPSEGKAKVKSTDLTFDKTKFKFEREVNQVVRLLSLLNDEDLRSIYGTSQEKSEIFHRQNQDIFKSHCAKAIERYTGVVYEYIDWRTLDKSAKNYMENHVRIFSGLFGMLTPNTLIPNYKLKMNVLSLQYHWSPIITKELESEDVIFDLLPQVHRKAYKPSKNVIVWGAEKKIFANGYFPSSELSDRQRESGFKTILGERGYLKRDKYYSIGLTNYANEINNEADFKNEEMPDDRAKDLNIELKPWKQPDKKRKYVS